MYKSVSTLAIFAYITTVGSAQGLEMLIQYDGPWGKWRDFFHCPREYAHCGVQMKREAGKKSIYDDYGATSLKFKCCHIDDWTVQNEYIAYDENRGDWRDWMVCDENSWIHGFETRRQSSSVSDDTSMTGIRIKCDSLDLKNQHYLEDSFDYGSWITQEEAEIKEEYKNLLSCGSVLKVESNQGVFSDDTALNGYMTEICHEFISEITGFWALRP